MNKTIVTAENFDSRNLFANINKESIADIFSDPDSDTVESLNSRLRGVSLSSVFLDEIASSVEFADDDAAKDWCRFVSADDADRATADYARWCLRRYKMECYLDDAIRACNEVAEPKAFIKVGRINKTVCRMLYDRMRYRWYHSEALIDNWGNAFTRTPKETKQLYRKMLRNPEWAERAFGRGLDWMGKYQWLQFQRLFGLPDIESTKKKLKAELQSACDSPVLEELSKYDRYALVCSQYIPTFSINEVLPPAKTVENALLYWSVLHVCLGD